MYVPTDASDINLSDPSTWDSLDHFIRGEPCLQKQRGRIMRRNSCGATWRTILNARLSKEIPTAGGQSIELIADLFNVLNLLDGDWGVQRQYPSTALLHLAEEIPLRPEVTTYPFDAVDRALDDLAADRVVGTAVLAVQT